MYGVRVCIFKLTEMVINMRHGTNRRQRGRGGNQQRQGGNQRMKVFDSNGPDVRIRGTAHQVTEKYLALAKDAASSGDRTLAENYLQHAEHYQRIINSWVQEETAKQDTKQPEAKKADKTDAKSNDLALPASILGENAKAETQERTAEVTA